MIEYFELNSTQYIPSKARRALDIEKKTEKKILSHQSSMKKQIENSNFETKNLDKNLTNKNGLVGQSSNLRDMMQQINQKVQRNRTSVKSRLDTLTKSVMKSKQKIQRENSNIGILGFKEQLTRPRSPISGVKRTYSKNESNDLKNTESQANVRELKVLTQKTLNTPNNNLKEMFVQIGTPLNPNLGPLKLQKSKSQNTQRPKNENEFFTIENFTDQKQSQKHESEKKEMKKQDSETVVSVKPNSKDEEESIFKISKDEDFKISQASFQKANMNLTNTSCFNVNFSEINPINETGDHSFFTAQLPSTKLLLGGLQSENENASLKESESPLYNISKKGSPEIHRQSSAKLLKTTLEYSDETKQEQCSLQSRRNCDSMSKDLDSLGELKESDTQTSIQEKLTRARKRMRQFKKKLGLMRVFMEKYEKRALKKGSIEIYKAVMILVDEEQKYGYNLKEEETELLDRMKRFGGEFEKGWVVEELVEGEQVKKRVVDDQD
jgi:hypothetical protein